MKLRWLGCLFLISSAWQSAVWAEAIELAEPESDARVRSVRSHVQVTGELMTAAGGGKVIPLKLTSDAQYRFLERRLSGAGRDAETLRSARVYRFANSEIEVVPSDAPAGAAAPKKSTLKLPESRHLIVAHGRREGPFLYSPTATLTFDQLDLIRTPGDSLAALGLLPREPVSVGDSWKPESWAVPPTRMRSPGRVRHLVGFIHDGRFRRHARVGDRHRDREALDRVDRDFDADLCEQCGRIARRAPPRTCPRSGCRRRCGCP